MPYSNFSFIEITKKFGIALEERIGTFASRPEIEVDAFFKRYLTNNIPLAKAIGTEKAKSEMIVAPVLIEVRRILNNEISLFSGIEFNVDFEQGLTGFCDFIISLSPQQLYIESPAIALVEAKNDNLKAGLAQCMAEMIAAHIFNEREGQKMDSVYGIVTNGDSWQFLELRENKIYIDLQDYHVGQLEKLVGIIISLIQSFPNSPKVINTQEEN